MLIALTDYKNFLDFSRNGVEISGSVEPKLMAKLLVQ